MELDQFLQKFATLINNSKIQLSSNSCVDNQNQSNPNPSGTTKQIQDEQRLYLEVIYKKLSGIIEQCQSLQTELIQAIKSIKNSNVVEQNSSLISDLEIQLQEVIEQSMDVNYFITNIQKFKQSIIFQADNSIQILFPKKKNQENQNVKLIEELRQKYNMILTNPEYLLPELQLQHDSCQENKGTIQYFLKLSQPIQIQSIKEGEKLNQHKNTIYSIIQFKSPKNKFDNCLITGSGDNTVKIWNSQTLECVETLPFNGGIITVCQVNQESIAIDGSQEIGIQVWNLSKKLCVAKLEGHTDNALDLQLLENNKMLSCSCDKQIILWDLSKYSMIKKFNKEHEDIIQNILLMNQNEFISSSFDSSLKLWKVEQNSSMKTMKSNSQILSLVKISSNNIISGHESGELIQWNVSTGQQLGIYKAHTNWVNCVITLSPSMILTISDDKSMKILQYDENFKIEEKFVSTQQQLCQRLYSSTIIQDNQVAVVGHNGLFKIFKFK